MGRAPVSGPISAPPQALRPRDLARVLARLAESESPTPSSEPEPEREPELERVPLPRIDLLAGTTTEAPVSSAPRAVAPARGMDIPCPTRSRPPRRAE